MTVFRLTNLDKVLRPRDDVEARSMPDDGGIVPRPSAPVAG